MIYSSKLKAIYAIVRAKNKEDILVADIGEASGFRIKGDSNGQFCEYGDPAKTHTIYTVRVKDV